MKKVTSQQINAAKLALFKIQNDIQHEFELVNPVPSYEVEQAWKLKHISPIQKHRNRVNKLLAPTKKKHDNLLLRARMNQIDGDQLYKEVIAIQKDQDQKKKKK